jgi:hypothetical protein
MLRYNQDLPLGYKGFLDQFLSIYSRIIRYLNQINYYSYYGSYYC